MSDNNKKNASIIEISDALSIKKRSAERRALTEAWPYEETPVRGGKQRLYPIISLPQDIQQALSHQAVEHLDATPNTPTPPDDERARAQAQWFDTRPEKTKARARAKLALVQDYFTLKSRGFDEPAVRSAVQKQHGVSYATLRQALLDVRGKPEHLWLYALTDAYAGRATGAPICAEAREALMADFLRAERPSAASCVTRVIEAARTKGWQIPARRTMERMLQKLPRSLTTLRREGATAAKGLYPSQQRLKTALTALEIINGDGYKHNLWVRFPDGDVIRAKTWFWQDVYSSKILAWRTDKTEHTDVIRLSFGDVVEQWGIPNKVLLDNTLAAANKTMSGGVKHRFRFRVREDEPLGVFPLIVGPDPVIWATPGHGQAKPVERTFGIGGVGEYIDKAPEFAGAWTGGSPLDKPDYDGITRTVNLDDLQRVIAREVAAFNAREGRRGAMHQGRSFDQVFQESYERIIPRRASEAQRRLWLLATEPIRTNTRNGEFALESGRIVGERVSNRYWNAELVEWAGKSICARFDPTRLHEGVHVYSADGRYICFAECVQAAGFNDQNAGREHNRARQQFLRATRAQADAEVRMTALEAAKAYAGAAPATIPPAAASAVERGNVVRAEFRDPLARPVREARADTAEEAAERAALAAEMRSMNVVKLNNERDEPDDWAAYRRYLAIGERLATGADVSGPDRAWHHSYGQSSECRTFAMLAEEFPQKLQERRAG